MDCLTTKNFNNFFTILNIDENFLKLDPRNRSSNDTFIKIFEVVKSLHVTNDHAERGVGLVRKYAHLTRDENQLKHFDDQK